MHFTRSSIALALATLSAPLLTSANVDCTFGERIPFQLSDVSKLISNLQTGNLPPLTDPLDLRSVFSGRTSSYTMRAGSARLDVENAFLFASTHATFAAVAGAVQAVQSTCCSLGTCIAGQTTVAGDTGLVINVKVNPNS